MKHLIQCVISLCLFCVAHGQLYAVTINYDENDQNMFMNPADNGWSNKVQVAGTSGEEGGQKDGFVTVVKNAINWILGSLALITLIILLWGGFQMVTAAGDDGKYDEGFKLLKQAAGGLLMIGVAWFIVSIIFYVIKLITT